MLDTIKFVIYSLFISFKNALNINDIWLLLLILLIFSSSSYAQSQKLVTCSHVYVKPVCLVPKGVAAPTNTVKNLLMQHLYWTQSRYFELMWNRDTFDIVGKEPLILNVDKTASEVTNTADGFAEGAVTRLFAQDKVDRFSCPYIYVIFFIGTGGSPAGGGRPINGYVNTGGGVVIMGVAENSLTTANFQSTLQHELGHAFGLVHVDSYNYDMNTNASIMSYNPSHHTIGFEYGSSKGILIPEDYRVLALNHKVFDKFYYLPEDIPNGYNIYGTTVLLVPMTLNGHYCEFPWNGIYNAPAISSPVNNAVNVPVNVSFNWKTVDYALSYTIEISKNVNFINKISTSSSATNLSTTLEYNTTYFWRIRGNQGNNSGAWSPTYTFTTTPFVATSGVDAAISLSKSTLPPIGFGVVNNNGSQQSVTMDQTINRQSEFLIIVKNTGNVPDNFIITSNSAINSKWKVGVFDIGGKNYTKEVFNGGWLLSALRPGESIKLFLRIVTYSGQVIDANNPPTQSINITSHSRNDIAKGVSTPAADTVTATAVLTKASGIK